MSVLVRMIDPQYNALQVTVIGILVALIALSPRTIAHWGSITQIQFTQPHIWLSIFYLGAVSTASSFVIWNKGLQLMSSNLSGLFFLFQPIVGALAWLALSRRSINDRICTRDVDDISKHLGRIRLR